MGLVRNQCAHEERLYNTVYSNTDIRNIKRCLNITDCPNNQLVVAVLYLRVFLNKKDFSVFKKGLINLIDEYNSKIRTVPFDNVLRLMGISRGLLNSL